MAREVARSGGRRAGKAAEVERAVAARDAERLAELSAEPGGLVSDFLRRRAWPLLLAADADDASAASPKRAKTRDALVQEFNMDIERSMFHFGCDKALPRDLRVLKREALTEIILNVLRADATLHYYQGFHDVATVHLHVMGNDIRAASETTLAASRLQFKDHHGQDFGATIQAMNLLPVIIHHFDHKVSTTLERAEVGPMFALAWVLTGFAHSVQDLNVTARLFDIILASHPLLCIYLAAALVLRPTTRRRLLEVAEEDCSMPTIHHFLQNIAPPCAPMTSRDSWEQRNKKYKAQRKRIAKRQASAGAPVSGSSYVPATRAEEKENCVDNLVESALFMMARFPPADLIRVGERTRNVDLPKLSAMRLPLKTRRAWIASMNWAVHHARWTVSHPAATAAAVAAVAVALALVWTRPSTVGAMAR
ncbi:TBC1 domain family member 20 [Hondaea fermentalgiana]|uniref:TBC1 domain family member 20 n=1 Tax=Hondaea fermentalgiana TaxID=2315210 RepID=A0A2R5GLV8_9STRA|nr:TBC1 domain family member 20 [Hondaea fermentalgiana]|eukprot:GBG28854.1 TBC1 domain family member 20 [Hondaea fermentalgiana]